jgi:cell fate regulator YaaT (PSP1 superfamily)
MVMPLIVGVRFRPVTKIYYFDPNQVENLEPDMPVIVETSRGIELGTVVQTVHEVPNDEVKGKLKRVVRRATPVDLLHAQHYKAEETYALAKCDELIQSMNIPIKVLEADYSFDGSRLVFSFVSEQRVDFRDLVKELSRALETRIEMKQVGARDETKILDGYGRCGRRLCCSSWLTEFHPVSIRMAKNQGLPLAPAEISGICGRLLCCLAYENEQYQEIKSTLPKVNSQVKLRKGGQVGIVRGLNVIKETVLLEIEDREEFLEILANETEPFSSASSSHEPKKSEAADDADLDEQQ